MHLLIYIIQRKFTIYNKKIKKKIIIQLKDEKDHSSLIALLLFVGCNRNSKKENSLSDKTSKDYIIGIDSKGDILTLEDIENTIDSLNYYLVDTSE